MNVDTGVFTALAERVEQLDRQMQALSRGLVAAGAAACRPEIAAEVDALMHARSRARLQLLEGGRS
jgi:uncharacterized membrane-anchored protein